MYEVDCSEYVHRHSSRQIIDSSVACASYCIYESNQSAANHATFTAQCHILPIRNIVLPHFPNICRFQWGGGWAPSNTLSLEPTRPTSPNDSSKASHSFLHSTWSLPTERQTDRRNIEINLCQRTAYAISYSATRPNNI